MFRELCITLTMRAVALGHSPDEVEELLRSSFEDLTVFSCLESDDSQHSPPPGLMTCRKAQCLAVLALIQLVLLCTLFGYRRILPGEENREEERAVPAQPYGGFAGMRGTGPSLFRTTHIVAPFPPHS